MTQDVVVADIQEMPVSGRDYPRTWDQFLDWFPDNDACIEYLEGIRWPDGFSCPQCGRIDEPYRTSRGRLVCRDCRHQCTVTAGTIFDKTRTSLRSWLAAVWYITNQKQGVTALGLQRVLGLGSYQTAWTMLHRLRRAMIRPGRERLSGVVEVDECFVGHTPRQQKPVKKKGKKTVKQQDSGNTVIAVAVEIKLTKGFGRIRLSRIAAPSQVALMPFIKDSIEPGSIVHTDGSAAYRLLSKNGYRRMKTVMHGNEKPAHVSMPGVHRVASLLKRWLLGTHQGAIRPQQLAHYLDEFVFRFNRRTSRSRGLLFYRLLEQAMLTEPLTYSQIAGGSKHKI
jgi:transposase-like protein